MQRGRGRNFTPRRRLGEALVRQIYRGGWPARCWARVPGACRVERLYLELPVLPPEAPPLHLAWVSDLHLGPTTPRCLLDRAFEHLDAIAPQVLVLGGDFFYLRSPDAAIDELAQRVARVPASIKLAVWGNHDLWLRHASMQAALEAVGVKFLVNDAVRLPAPHQDVALLGLDDPWSGHADLPRAEGAAAGVRASIVLCHSPDAIPETRDRGHALYLCGHTHGGMLVLPGGFMPWDLGGSGKDYPYGLHRVGGMRVFVSRGVGGVLIPFRLGAPPDVVELRLVAQGRAA